MSLELTTIVAVIAGTVVAIAAFLAWWINRAPRVRRDESGILPLFGGMANAEPEAGVMAGGTVRLQARTPAPALPAITAPASAPRQEARGTQPPEIRGKSHAPELRVTPQAPSSATADAVAAGKASPAVAHPAIRTFTTTSPARRPQTEAAATPTASGTPPPPAVTPVVPSGSAVTSHGVPGTMVEGHLVRFSVPQEGTLQFLPGRLEIGAGLDSGREIRFVHVPGPNGMEVTFGRSEGELYRHIQLRDQTVSRSHARMRLVDGHWYLLNLSQTNPIVHNGDIVSNGNEHLLTDGDRIEMGEVLFTFRSR